MIPESFNTHFYRGVFTDGDRYSIDFVWLCQQQEALTFNKSYLNPKHPDHPLETPFHEIRMAFPHEYCFHPIIKKQPRYIYSYEELLRCLHKAIESYLMNLSDKQRYLCFHSSGLDSRFISGTMARLRNEGKRDFKNVHFRCHEPEVDQFLEIMDREGWPKDQYSYHELRGEDNYDVGRPDISVNGWCSYTHQMNFWSEMIGNEKDWVVMLGEGSDIGKFMGHYRTAFRYCENECLNMLIDHTGGKGEWDNQFALTFKDISMPMWGFECQRVYAQMQREWLVADNVTGWDNMRIALVEQLGVGGVEFIEHVYSWNLSEKRKRGMLDAFYRSKFYRRYKHDLPKDIDFFTNMYGWESKLWGFAVTVYEKIFT